MTIEIKIPSNERALAAAIGAALVAWGGGEVLGQPSVTSNERKIGKAPELAAAYGEPAAEKPLAETATGQASSTETQNSVAVGAKTQSSEKKLQVDAASAETATTQQDATLNTAGAATGALTGNAPDNFDEKGVGFNAQYCSKAAIPFNQTGKKKGQWKRRQGVPEDVYDTWHEGSVAAAIGNVNEEVRQDQDERDAVDSLGQSNLPADQQVNTAGAFTPANNVTTINTAAAFNESVGGKQAPQAGSLTFADAGEFMKWLSEQQTAKLLTTDDVDSAYKHTSVAIGDLFDPSKAAAAVAAVYKFLAPIVEGER